MRLPGVGPVTAPEHPRRPHREAVPQLVADLDRVKGIGPKTLEKIRPFVVME